LHDIGERADGIDFFGLGVVNGSVVLSGEKNLFVASARTLASRPTMKGVICCGKMTISRTGIMGTRFISCFSLLNIRTPEIFIIAAGRLRIEPTRLSRFF
jgi:hypothetical protein